MSYFATNLSFNRRVKEIFKIGKHLAKLQSFVNGHLLFILNENNSRDTLLTEMHYMSHFMSFLVINLARLHLAKTNTIHIQHTLCRSNPVAE